MLESGSSGSVRGVLSNEHPYREPGPIADIRSLFFTAFGSHLTPIVFWRLVFVFPALFIGHFTGVD